MSHLSLCVFLKDPRDEAGDGVAPHVPELEAGEAGALVPEPLRHRGQLPALGHAGILNTKL